ncbi:hypothetical protein HCG51_00810 [Tolypothrix sp. PCC 7910]|uniref:hypothetical protein n=1 Tax=Tolypothrix sp. PCC 7910 TaxID=2099387 RepID=UPI00142797F7|nr:hypothetical protein [Tolypothrix sp. PCC 7910]QIR35430.1 hypothetical protein HCG51_00810 [Tolypothrix sp. PCC 7910]
MVRQLIIIPIIFISLTGKAEAATFYMIDRDSRTLSNSPNKAIVTQQKAISLRSVSSNNLSFDSSYDNQFSDYIINSKNISKDASISGNYVSSLPIVGANIVATYHNKTIPNLRPDFIHTIKKPLNSAKLPSLAPVVNHRQITFDNPEKEAFRFQPGANFSFPYFSKRLTKVANQSISTGAFINPKRSSSISKNNFTWVSKQPSQFTFIPKVFNPKPDEVFSLAEIKDLNGTIVTEAEVDSKLDNIMKNNQQIIAGLSLINTLNPADPETNTDNVSINLGIFTSKDTVLEESSTSANLLAKFVADTVTPSTILDSSKSLVAPLDFPTISTMGIQILGFSNSSQFGFMKGDYFSESNKIKPVPEPTSTLPSLIGLLLACYSSLKKRVTNPLQVK